MILIKFELFNLYLVFFNMYQCFYANLIVCEMFNVCAFKVF
ncbi:hypothetical protein PROVRETT_08294 [Providencia rettgeri DSM 1131]|nr:hypothetical protein PROVRETT_08294 [Providencia rettgeri DSM 1131]